MVDRTGIMGGVSFAVSRPEVSAAISTPQINRGHHVPLLAGADTDSSITHIDSRVPESFSDGSGGTYSPDPHLHVHETVEKWVMEHGAEHADELGLTPDDFVDTPSGPRVKYEVAHDRFALPAEKASVEAAGIPWKLYNAHMAGSYAGIKGKKADASPASLYTAPYEDSGATGLLSPSKDADMDYFGGLLGNSIDPAGTAGLMGIPQMRRSGHVAGRPAISAPAYSNPDWMMHWKNLYGDGPEPISAPDETGGGGSDLSIADPGVTPAGGPPMSPPTPSPAGSLFGPQNADLISSLGGALLGAPTVREGLGAFGQQAPAIMARDRARNATIDYLNSQGGANSAYLKNPKFQAMLYANPELAQQLVMPHRVWNKTGTDALGREQYNFTDAISGTVTDAHGNPVDTGGSGGGGDQKPGSIYNSLPAQLKSMADAIYAGDMPPISGRSLSNPVNMMVMSAVNDRAAMDGQVYDATIYGGKQGMRNYMTFGKGAELVTQGNTAVAHLGELEDTIQNLAKYASDSGVPFGNAWLNQARIAAARGTGSPLAQAIAQFDAVRKKYSAEATKFYAGVGGGGEGEREQAEQQFDAASSPEELLATTQSQIGLLEGKIKALQTQWHTAMDRNGRKAEDFPIVSPDSQKVIDRVNKNYTDIKAKGGGGDAAAAIPPMPPSVPPGSHYSPSYKVWGSPDGHIFDETGNMVQ